MKHLSTRPAHLALLPALVALALLTGCGSSTPEPKPTATPTATPTSSPTVDEHGDEHHHLVGDGTSASLSGFELKLLTEKIREAGDVTISFKLLRDGTRQVGFPVEHGAQLHMALVRDDLGWMAHLHPMADGAGDWSVSTYVPVEGNYHMVVQFVDSEMMGDHRMTYALGSDLTIGTELPDPVKLPAFMRTVSVDGYAVTISGTVSASEHTDLSFTITKGGNPVVLDDYFDAKAHVIGFRTSDKAYVHLHGGAGAQDGVADVAAEFGPGEGTYRLFVEFSVDGKVHQAAFTVDVA